MAMTHAAKSTLHFIGRLPGPQRREQCRQIDQIGRTKMRPSGGHDHERVLGLDAGPARWQREKIPIRIAVENPVLTPSLLSINEIDFPSE